MDAVAADLGALALPTHQSFKYIEPEAYRMDLGPVLGVYVENVAASLFTTESDYNDLVELKITWREANPQGAESNEGQQDMALAALGRAQLILDRLRTYGSDVPGTTVRGALTRVEFVRANFQWGPDAYIALEVFE
jgi:hypothetical protein